MDGQGITEHTIRCQKNNRDIADGTKNWSVKIKKKFKNKKKKSVESSHMTNSATSWPY